MIRRRVGALVAVAAVTAATALLATTSPALAVAGNVAPGIAQDAPLPGLLLNSPFGCLQPVNGSLDAAAAVVQEPCDETNLAQRWVDLDGFDAHGDVIRYQNVNSNLCLDAFGPAANGTRVIQWPCNSISNERWQHIIPDLIDVIDGPIHSRVSGTSSFCLDVPNASPQMGLQMQIFRCNGTDAQQWTFFFG